MGKKWAAIWSIISAMLMALLQLREGFKSQHETIVSIVDIIIVALVVFLAQFLVNLVRHSALASKTANEKLVTESAKHADEIQKLTAQLAKVNSEQNLLKIEAMPCRTRLGNEYDCQVKIINPNKTEPAERLKVELIKIDPAPKFPAFPSNDLPIKYPVRLIAANQGGETINADRKSVV